MLGTVTVLRRYPVKSMLGENLDEAEVSRSGLARDRRLAVVSRRTGKVASAKYPRLWRDMLTLSAAALDDDDRPDHPSRREDRVQRRPRRRRGPVRGARPARHADRHPAGRRHAGPGGARGRAPRRDKGRGPGHADRDRRGRPAGHLRGLRAAAPDHHRDAGPHRRAQPVPARPPGALPAQRGHPHRRRRLHRERLARPGPAGRRRPRAAGDRQDPPVRRTHPGPR